MAKASLPKGMRDFLPSECKKRAYIFDCIRNVYEQYGFKQIETPSVENIETLTGKYGDEGDKLIFRVLKSGDFLSKADTSKLNEKDYKALLPQISDKGLRYDLTVPLARFVVMNLNELNFPFKRYQMQNVWRADRPQKGRYREFVQCDADVIGSDSLLNDAEFILIFDEVFGRLGLHDIRIHLNNRKILAGIAESFDIGDKFIAFTVIIDKLDKIGHEGVINALIKEGFQAEVANQIMEILNPVDDYEMQKKKLRQACGQNELVEAGLAEIDYICELIDSTGLKTAELKIDFTLARGLDYYTSTIYEVKAGAVNIGSIASGGRYDKLTETFGIKEMPGVGISFGADRIYDVLEELELFPPHTNKATDLLILNMGAETEKMSFKMAATLRKNSIKCDMYPKAAKMKKQLGYADKENIPFVLIIGEEEIKKDKFTLKNMLTAEQEMLSEAEIIKRFS